jgi:hypothetical protein
VIPYNARVRIQNVHNDRALEHVNGFEADVVYSYTLPYERGRRYIVCVNGLDYDLSYSELAVLDPQRS